MTENPFTWKIPFSTTASNVKQIMAIFKTFQVVHNFFAELYNKEIVYLKKFPYLTISNSLP